MASRRKLPVKQYVVRVNAHEKRHRRHTIQQLHKIRNHDGFHKSGKAPRPQAVTNRMPTKPAGLNKHGEGLWNWVKKGWNWVKGKTKKSREKIKEHAKKAGKRVLEKGKAAAASTVDKIAKAAEDKVTQIIDGLAHKVDEKITQGSAKVQAKIDQHK